MLRAEQASARSSGHRQGHGRLKVKQAAREVRPMDSCQWLPVMGLIRVLLGSPSHRENVFALKETVLL